MDICKLAPEGWRCQREYGHPGPCAAVPVATQTDVSKVRVDVAKIVEESNREAEEFEAACRGLVHPPTHNDKILKHFEYAHLPPHLAAVSSPFHAMAHHIHRTIVSGPERSVSLRKLLEAKDAAVRAKVHPGG